MTSIYILERNGIPFYVGKTKGKWRKTIHKRNHIDVVYNEIDVVEDEQWKFWEQYWICQFKTWGFKLENKNDGGGGPEQYTEEQKQKMRKPHKEGTGAKISRSLTGRKYGPQSEETKQKVKLARTGKPQPNISKAKLGKPTNKKGKPDGPKHTDESKKKISEKILLKGDERKIKIGKANSKPVSQIKDNQIINQHESTTKASIITGISIGSINACLKQRSKSAGGFVWKYTK